MVYKDDIDRKYLRDKWNKVISVLSLRFSQGENLDIDNVLYIIGLREFGQVKTKFSKDQKVNLMHIAICRLLEPYGYYAMEGIDHDGWPHYSEVEKLPNMSVGEQTIFLKKAVINYLEDEKII
ncbi:hypothetical protein [Ichthyobacterium seriolicida]|uniref:Uncharacterized protein n=1 Tax=Ichthyobacterium seriolicida TaxID=242600 RepID=A0A1J1DXI5_9FLAO|nr:hypothetical protein [Ichthyobacterium seriolicida]BAV94567.1 hypothetical protein JBKA6_0554 [Ichthyobacterium seriolicida]